MNLSQQMRRARRRLMFLGLRQVLRLVGFERARALGSRLGTLQFWLTWRARRRLQAQVAQVLGRSPDDPAVPALLLEAYRVNNGAVMEIMAMFDRRQDETMLVKRCEVVGLEHLRSAMTQGHGAILLATHMGNAALAAISIARAGWPVSVVYREARMMSAGFLQTGLEHYGIQGILANAGLRAYGQMLSALKKGRVLFVMLDQGVKQAEDGLMHRFLGKDMAMPAGPAQLARVTRSPVLPLVTAAASPLWSFAIEPPLSLGGETVGDDVESLIRMTERQVLRAPQLWSWHHRRWRKLPMPVASVHVSPAASSTENGR